MRPELPMTNAMTHVRIPTLAALTIVAALGASPALAQSSAWGTNGYVSINGLYETVAKENDLATRQDIHAETATITATQETGQRPLYDVTAGGRLRGNLGFGFGATFGQLDNEARVRGDIPHPFYFNQTRSLDGTAALERTDLMINLAAMWLIPASERVQLSLFGGPTWFQLKQQVVKSVTLTEGYPFDAVALNSVERERLTETAWGYHAGFDVSYFFSRHAGVQGLVRYSNGTVTLTTNGVDSDITVGGLHVGVGLRVRY